MSNATFSVMYRKHDEGFSNESMREIRSRVKRCDDIIRRERYRRVADGTDTIGVWKLLFRRNFRLPRRSADETTRSDIHHIPSHAQTDRERERKITINLLMLKVLNFRSQINVPQCGRIDNVAGYYGKKSIRNAPWNTISDWKEFPL